MKRVFCILYILIMSLAVSSCEREEIMPDMPDMKEGYMPVNFTFSAPDMIEADTKAVDPDGKGVNSMILFCFDNFGIYISYEEVRETEIDHNGAAYPYLTGTVKETPIPENTRRIHFIANLNAASFDDTEFKGKSEREVINSLEGSSGMMNYWGYFAPDDISITDSEAFKSALEVAHGAGKGTPLRLLRNQARFVVKIETGNFNVSGFTVVNTNAFGTAAPYHPTKGFKFTMETDGNDNWAGCDWTATDFITLPENTTRLTPPIDVDIADETCVFETDNNSAQPVSIIIKGKNNESAPELYYRVILMDSNGEFIKVRRNFNYTVNIKGELSYGQHTFAQALIAPATNNVWLSIDDDVNEVSDGSFSLNVKETAITILAKKNGELWELYKPANGENYDLIEHDIPGHRDFHTYIGYNVTKLDGTSLDSNTDKPQVTWVEGGNLSGSGLENVFSTGTGGNVYAGEGEIGVFLDQLDNLNTYDRLEGTILVKKGLLQRKIKITILKEMKFNPVWVSTQVNAAANENVTLLFTIPESIPDELLPFDVYVSVNHLDARNVQGRTFPIITRLSDPDKYGIDTYTHYTYDDVNGVYVPAAETPIGYKYVYTVTEKGDQRMYFTNLIDRTNNNVQEFFTIESPYFATVHKPFTFNLTGDKRIELPFLEWIEGNNNGTMDDDEVKYILVPQKINYKVEFDFALTQTTDGTKTDNETGSSADEFLIYTENLSHKTEDHECIWEFESFDEGYSAYENLSTGGRVMAFKFKNDNTNSESKSNRNVFPMYMYTSKAKSAEVIRISSNHPTSPSAFNPTVDYTGNSYRSIIFEFANYHPFHFNAKLNGFGTNVNGNNEEKTDNVQLKYDPSDDVKISLNIQKFTGADGKEVDPFGYEFPIFIVAPMLDEGSSGTVEIMDNVFMYTIDSDGTNAITDLVFKKDRIVPEGNILITTDPELAGVDNIKVGEEYPYKHQVVNFFNKTFTITSAPITGTITKSGTGVSELNMTEGAFVSFALTRNNSRIGSMKIHGPDSEHTNSWYELTLRPEYEFSWNNDPIKITHTHENAQGEIEVFTATIVDLATLNTSKDIILTKENIE